MRKYKNKIIFSALVLSALAFVLWWGGDAPSLRGRGNTSLVNAENIQPAEENNAERHLQEIKAEEPPAATQTAGDEENTDLAEKSAEINKDAGADKIKTPLEADQKPTPEQATVGEVSPTAYTCTLSVKCDTILNNMDWLDENKKALLPDDGVILPETEVIFYEGESVFNLLVRELKKNKIHLEFMNTPVYKSAYIEGINNLYEFDCGELSGWMYKVNGSFPNYGCSRYNLKAGDAVEWVYTCDLGKDVGGEYLQRQRD